MLSQTRRKNSVDSQSAFCTHYAVCSLHFVSGLRSAICTNRYPWHQYSLFLVTVIRTTYPIYHKIPVCELTRHFCYFRFNTLLSFCKKLDITYNVSSNPTTPKKITPACIACLCLSLEHVLHALFSISFQITG